MHHRSDSPPLAASKESHKSAGRAKRNLVTATIICVVVAVTLVVAGQATKPQLTGDTITQTFSQGEPCATASIALAVPGDAEQTKIAESLFAALEPVQGLLTGTYNWKISKLEVGYCESKSSETAIRQALAPTGLVAEADTSGAATPESTTPSQ